MLNCLNCGSEITVNEKRGKKFCSEKCKLKYWRKNNQGERKYVQYKTYLAVLKELEKFKNIGTKNQLVPPSDLKGVDLLIWKQEHGIL